VLDLPFEMTGKILKNDEDERGDVLTQPDLRFSYINKQRQKIYKKNEQK